MAIIPPAVSRHPPKGRRDHAEPATFAAFEAQYAAGRLWVGIWHPFLTGRLSRWRMVEDWLEQILARGDIWFAPLEDIAAPVSQMRASGP